MKECAGFRFHIQGGEDYDEMTLIRALAPPFPSPSFSPLQRSFPVGKVFGADLVTIDSIDSDRWIDRPSKTMIIV